MESTWLVRRVDDLGRVVIPKSVRNNLKIEDGCPLEIFIDGDLLIYRKFNISGKLEDAIHFLSEMIVDNAADIGAEETRALREKIAEMKEILGIKSFLVPNKSKEEKL